MIPKGQRTTHDQFTERVRQLYNDEIQVLGVFTRTKDKVRVRHVCGHEWDVIANSIASGKYGCPCCASNAMLEHEEFVKRVRNAVGDSVEILSEYKGSGHKVKVRYSCGHESNAYPHDILNGHMCKRCKGRKSHEQYVSDLLDKYGDEYDILGEYTTVYTKTMHRHNKCGYVWEARPNALLMGHMCPKCFGSIKTHGEYVSQVKDVHGEKIKVVGTYQTRDKGILHECEHGHQFVMSPRAILECAKCPACFPKKKTHEQYAEEIEEKFDGDYSVVDKYKGASVKITHRHNVCGTEWSIKPNALLSGYGCPYCRESKGEKLIHELLTERSIDFKPQFKFDDCRGERRPLPFDFAVLKDEKVILLIEWDGRQHFEPVKAFDGEEGLKRVQETDAIKNKYCDENKIPLLRFSYRMNRDQVVSKLDTMLNNLGVI